MIGKCDEIGCFFGTVGAHYLSSVLFSSLFYQVIWFVVSVYGIGLKQEQNFRK